MIGGSLCSGSGGLDLGLERALGVEWAWHAEIDAAASKILAHHWPGTPNLGDFTAIEWEDVPRVELLAAGFPCPDYSLAGRRAGIDGEHGQVWHSVARAVRALRPAVVVLENVDGIRSAAGPVGGDAGESALGVVLADLADLGYRWAYDRIRAADVGAPHGRLRWFCVAALPSAADAVGAGVDADGRVRGRAARASGRGGSAPSAVAAGAEVDGAADALPDDPGAAADEAPADAERRRREQHDEGERGVPVAREGGAPARLLPTPTAGDGKASGSRNLEGSKAHPGVSLTDAVQTGDSRTPGSAEDAPVASDANDGPSNVPGLRDGGASIREAVRLLPTPQAADGDGGRQEKGAMANHGERPSGQKATLPLPTAVGMRDELDARPFARPIADDEQLVLLPTPVANSDNPGTGGELRAAVVHGEGRRNETGVDTLGRPNRGRSAPLLPTPTTQDGENCGARSQRERNSQPLNVTSDLGASLLPTPETVNRKSRKAMTSSTENGRRSGGGNSSPPGLEQIVALQDGRLPDDLPPYEELPPSTRGIVDGFGSPEIEWGVYEAAVRRWETVFGYPAPTPTDEKGRLAPEFVEWMLGYPPGWFDVAGVSRTRKLRALGNSVQVQCGEAVGHWLAGLIESGLLLDG